MFMRGPEKPPVFKNRTATPVWIGLSHLTQNHDYIMKYPIFLDEDNP